MCCRERQAILWTASQRRAVQRKDPEWEWGQKRKKFELLASQRLELPKGRGRPGGNLIGRVGGGVRAEIDMGQFQERALRVRGCARGVRGWPRGNAGQEDRTPVLGEVGVRGPKLPFERGGLGTGLLGLREDGIWVSLPRLDGRRPAGLDSR